MSQAFSYRHLYYFWVVGKEGSISRAAQQLGMALEDALGHALLRPDGRGLALTDAGRAAMVQAEQIFELGAALPDVVRDAVNMPLIRLAVGISDGLPKLEVRRLLQPVMEERNLRLRCHEDQFEDLLGDLALHRLDVVLADRPATPRKGLRIYSHSLGTAGIAWYATRTLFAKARRGFPQSLAAVPLLLPTAHSAIRARIDHWFERQGLSPQVVGEFEDSALLATFGAAGMGAFPAAESVQGELGKRYGVERIGACTGVEEQFYAMVAERRIQHPLVSRLLPTRS
jgi:LysR family transcriptional regulator, transcriptional activator of nhaA